MRSLQKLNAVDLGFDPAGLVTMELPTAFAPFDGPATRARIEAAALGERIKAQPSVQSVALASNAPFGSHASVAMRVPGRPDPEIGDYEGPWISVVSTNFFKVMGMRLLSGRLFGRDDVRGSQPVAVVNATMARDFWGDASPFQSCILARGACARVVGVVQDVRDYRNGGPPPPRYYLSLGQQDDTATAVVARTTAADVPRVAALLKSLVPATQSSMMAIVDERVAEAMRPWRVAAQLFATVGAIALVLGCVGVYSVMSFVTSERVPEFGVRMVLGATAGSLVQLVLTGGLRLIGGGILLGLFAAAAAARLLGTLLFGVSPFEPVVYVTAVAILMLVGAVAVLIPALRVVRADPTVALRAE